MANRRSLLRAQLAESWLRTIRGPYSEQMLNSERGLQVHYCIELLRTFEASKVVRRLFVEPTILFKDGVRRSPDLLVCATKQVIGAIEFKFTPRARPSRAKDFDTLARLESAGSEIVVANERFRGAGDPKRFSVASDAVMCWAAVHPGPSVVQLEQIGTTRAQRWLILEAITSSGEQPAVVLNGRERGDA